MAEKFHCPTCGRNELIEQYTATFYSRAEWLGCENCGAEFSMKLKEKEKRANG